MSDPSSIPAKYDGNRLPNGQFVKGNTASKNNGQVAHYSYKALRDAWLKTATPDDLAEVIVALKEMCLNCPVPDVRLRAMVYYVDRCLGKPRERVEIDVNGNNSAPIIDMTSEEIQVFEKYIARTAIGAIDGTQSEDSESRD